MLNIEELKAKAHSIRQSVLEMCIEAGTGHVTSSFSCTEILVSLYYTGIVKFKKNQPKWEGRDRFVLSKGQASPILYAVLGDLGFFPRHELGKFCRPEGMFGVHLQHDVPGVEITSGSLGHGFGIAAGMAVAAKMDGKNHKVFALLGDGECYEGSIWESAMFAGHQKLDNLIAIVDRNWLCVTDFTEKIVKLDPLGDKFKASGFNVLNVNGHSFPELISALNKARSGKTGKPTVIIASTVKGKGVSFMESVPLWHGIAPKGEYADRAKKELGCECKERK